MEDEEWMSVEQAAERLASSRRVVTRWAQSGKLGEVKPGQIGRGKGMRVKANAVQMMIADRAEELQKRLVREAERKAKLDAAYVSVRRSPEGRIMVSKSNLNWMLDLASTLSDMADETIRLEQATPADKVDARRVFEGIAAVRESLGRIRDRRFQDDSGEEGGEG